MLRQHFTGLQENNTVLLGRTSETAENNNTSANRTFVPDNSLDKLRRVEEQQHKSGRGSIEAETGKPELNDNDEIENYRSADDSRATTSNIIARKEHLAMKINEEAETNKSLNESAVEESSLDDKKKEAEMTKHLSNLELNNAAIEADLCVKHFEEEMFQKQQRPPNEGKYNENNREHGINLNESRVKYEFNRDRESMESLDEEGDLAATVNINSIYSLEWEDLNHNSMTVDLSNDIKVNNIAAVQGMTIHPDAEFIDIHGATLSNRSMTNFGTSFEDRRGIK